MDARSGRNSADSAQYKDAYEIAMNIPRRSFLQELGDEFLRLLDNFRALAIIVLVRVFSLTRPSDTSMVSKKSISSDQKLKSGPSRKPDTEPQPKANVPAERSLPASSEHDNLLLCLTERHRTTIIGHIQLDAFKSDNELFTYLREIFYRQSPLRAPKQITYVQYDVFRSNGMVSLHEHQKGCSDSHCICFQPQSADLWLRIPSIVMLHYLRCSPNLPNSDNIWLDRIREVIRNSSKETRNNMETVWGLTVEKEYNWPKVLSITLLGLTLSTLVAFSWAAVAKSDTQEAFPVTLCIVLVTMVLSSLIATPDSRKADADFGTINKTSNDNFITTWKLSEPVGQTLHAQTKQSRSQRMSRYSISTFLLSIPEVWSRHLVRFGLGEEPIPQGKQRIRWHCACGKKLYRDYYGDVVVLERFQNKVESYFVTEKLQATYDGNQHSRSGILPSLRSLRMFPSYLLTFGKGTKGTELPTHNQQPAPKIHSVSSQVVPNQVAQPLFLLICVPSTGVCKKLLHEPIEDITTDRELFLRLQKTFGQELRAWYSRWSLRKPLSIDFVEITLMSGGYRKAGVSEHSHCRERSCRCLPPPGHSGYQYISDPEQRFPPIPPEMLLECLLHPNLIDKEQTWIYDCIPKKVNHQLKASLNAKTIGWGICINDGLDWNKIWTQVLVILGGCIIGALVGSICTGDWQSPWTIAGTISAALTSSLGFFATL